MRTWTWALLAMIVIAVVAMPGTALAEGTEVGGEIGVALPDDILTGDDGDEYAPTIGFKFVDGIDRHVGVFGGVSFFTADTSTFAKEPDVVVLRGGAEWLFGAPDRDVRWFVDLGGGLARYDVGSDDFNRAVATLGIGQRFQVGSKERIGWEVRAIQDITDDGPFEDEMLHVQALLGFGWGSTRPPADTDGDGVIDRRDDCPGTPRGATVDQVGCPRDTDGDGVYDGLDKCPDTPEGWPVDRDGCPTDMDGDGVPDGRDACPGTPKGARVDTEGCPKDTDGDGVYDGIDVCPDTPKGATVDAKGCPADSDGDGVYDGVDRCPDTPKGATVDATGCPKDSDGDGVLDGLDKCPDTPRGTPVDADGCPQVDVESRAAFVLRGVNFELNSEKLTADSTATLDLVVQTLKAYPNVRIEVGGHTDVRGSAAYNQRLSQRRAQSVVDYLTAAGIDRARLTAVGYGESKPIDAGNTEEAHAKNRRVELKRID